MRSTTTQCLKSWITGVLLITWLPACTQVSTQRLRVPVSEAASVGRLTQPRARPASERRLIAAGVRRGHAQIGPITGVRVVRRWQVTSRLPLPFWADVQKNHLVVEDPAGRILTFPLDEIEWLEVESTVWGTHWSGADIALAAAVSLITIYAAGAWINSLPAD